MTEPASQRAEESVIGAMLRSEGARLEVIGQGLESEHFYFKPYRLLYDTIIERYYADEAVDPLSVTEALGARLASQWALTIRETADKVKAIYATSNGDSAADHAKIIRRHADFRELLKVAAEAMQEASEQQRTPDEIAGTMSTAATRIVAGSLTSTQTYSYRELGSRWTRRQLDEIAARAAGADIGARYGIKAVDDFVKGQRPGELMIIGGDPGVGKSALVWAMATNFAKRQSKRPPEEQVGTLVWSGEMAEDLSSTRLAQIESSVPGDRFREGDLTRAEIHAAAQKWAKNADIPIYFNHSGFLRETQVKAMLLTEIRRGRNIGVFVIDHFRFIRTDERFEKVTEAEDQIVGFLAGLAKELNVCIICLAHTRGRPHGDTARPTMDDLRGSKMISAFAALVCFPYHPYRHASQLDIDQGRVNHQDYELIWEKVRSAAPGTGDLYMDLSTMTIR